MSIYYLYKKTRRITGLQYLGQPSKNPFKYEGSGVDWTLHIQDYGYDVDTEILLETDNKEEMKSAGRYYSKLWNVAESNNWANRIPETGGGPGGVKGRDSVKSDRCPEGYYRGVGSIQRNKSRNKLVKL